MNSAPKPRPTRAMLIFLALIGPSRGFALVERMRAATPAPTDAGILGPGATVSSEFRRPDATRARFVAPGGWHNIAQRIRFRRNECNESRSVAQPVAATGIDSLHMASLDDAIK